MFQPPLFAVVVAAALYHLGGRWRPTRRRGRRELWRSMSFYAGLATILLAVDSPLDSLADRSFTAHMTQHVLLLTAAAPLIVLAAPWTRMWRPFPLGFRRTVARAVVLDPRARPLRVVAHRLALPVVAWLVFDVDLLVWHIPALFDATLTNQWLHDGEHLLFLFTGLLFWAQVLDSPPFRSRLGWVERSLYATSAMLVSWVLAVVLAFAPHALYRPYVELAHRPGGLSALADQQVAAGVMWVPGSLAFTIAIVVFLYRFIGPEPQRARPRLPTTRQPLTTR